MRVGHVARGVLEGLDQLQRDVLAFVVLGVAVAGAAVLAALALGAAVGVRAGVGGPGAGGGPGSGRVALGRAGGAPVRRAVRALAGAGSVRASRPIELPPPEPVLVQRVVQVSLAGRRPEPECRPSRGSPPPSPVSSSVGGVTCGRPVGAGSPSSLPGCSVFGSGTLGSTGGLGTLALAAGGIGRAGAAALAAAAGILALGLLGGRLLGGRLLDHRLVNHRLATGSSTTGSSTGSSVTGSSTTGSAGSTTSGIAGSAGGASLVAGSTAMDPESPPVASALLNGPSDPPARRIAAIVRKTANAAPARANNARAL